MGVGRSSQRFNTLFCKTERHYTQEKNVPTMSAGRTIMNSLESQRVQSMVEGNVADMRTGVLERKCQALTPQLLYGHRF